MKFSDLVTLILVISGVFVMIAMAMSDYNSAYPESALNTSEFDKYNHIEDIEEQTNSLQNSWATIQNEDKGWKKFVTGLAAIPNVIISFPKIVISSFAIAGSVVTQGAEDLGIPKAFLAVLLAAITVFVLFGLIAWWQRSPT